jgi:regulator of extracellular matrix RemA (YlzA/DUF370 family)
MNRSASANNTSGAVNKPPQRADRWITVGRGGAFAADRVIAVGRASSASIKRLLEAAGPAAVVNLTYGDPRQTVLVMDTGHLVVVSQPLEQILDLLTDDGESP